MKKYYDCPTQNSECTYWDWEHGKCAMEVMDGDSPSGQCDEYDTFNDDEEYREIVEAAQEAHDNLVRSLIEAGGTVREARELLARSLEQLYILGYDSGFTNSEIGTLATDIKKFLEDTE